MSSSKRRCVAALFLALTTAIVNGLSPSSSSSSSSSSSNNKKSSSRRDFVQVVASSATAAGLLSFTPFSAAAASTSSVDATSYYQQFPSLFDPLYGKASNRKTIKKQLSSHVFVLEQSLVLGPLETPLRCTVIRLKDDSLWVHCPLAPTEEFFQLVESCCGEGGTSSSSSCPISHIVVPTYALEHKIFAKDALERWKDAKLWVSPYQFSFPFRSVPTTYLWGKPLADVGVLGESDLSPPPTKEEDDPQPSWITEIEYQSLVAGTFTIGGIPTPLCETVFFHKASKTMIVTDAVALIPREVPELNNPANLLLISKQSTSDPLPADTPEHRLIGWKKNCLLISFFFPEHEELDPDHPGTVTWTEGWEDNFDQLAGRLLVPPVVRTLLYRQNPGKVKEWVNQVSSRWDFNSIIPAHWDAPIAATPTEFQNCFRFLDDDTIDPFPVNDVKRGLKPLSDLALKGLSSSTSSS